MRPGRGTALANLQPIGSEPSSRPAPARRPLTARAARRLKPAPALAAAWTDSPCSRPRRQRPSTPRLRPLLAGLRDAFHDYRFALAQRDELRALHGDALDDPANPDRAEWQHWASRTAALHARVEGLVKDINALGADVKDPMLGLVDFYAARGNGHVLLCYRDDEDTIRYWHDVEAGFAGRRPLSEL
jgi:hypothetical protein